MKFIIFYGLFAITCATHASSWSDAWKNTNQRAMQRLEQQQFEAAEKMFTRKDWQAVAAFRNKHYTQAEKGFQSQEGAEGLYNQGNALAFQGKYKQAIETYQKALQLDPHHVDAEYNCTLLEDMLKNNPPESDQSEQSEKSEKSEKSDKTADSNKSEDSENNQDNDHQNPPSDPEPSKPNPESNPESERPSKPENAPEPKSPSEPKAKPQKNTGKDDKPSPEPSQQANASPTDADKQAKEQWLHLIPDDPGGLLKEKFWRDHMKRLQQGRS